MPEIRILKNIMNDARRHMEYLCDDLIRGRAQPTGGVWRPWTDVYETEDVVVIKIEMAGLEHGDAEVMVEGDVLTVRGERHDRCPLKKVAFHQMEIRYGTFERRIQINIPFDPDGIKARMVEGFLEVIVPKAEPPEPRRIKLNVQNVSEE